jgi:hypothetical protein
MKPEILREHILSYLAHARFRDQETGRGGSRTVRDMVDWLDQRAYFPETNRTLQKMESEGLVECLGKIEGKGNSIFWRLPVPEQKNTLVVIGYLGVRRAYLNMPEEAALKLHLESEWPEGWDEATEAETRRLTTSFEFTDRFYVYDADAI